MATMWEELGPKVWLRNCCRSAARDTGAIDTRFSGRNAIPASGAHDIPICAALATRRPFHEDVTEPPCRRVGAAGAGLAVCHLPDASPAERAWDRIELSLPSSPWAPASPAGIREAASSGRRAVGGRSSAASPLPLRRPRGPDRPVPPGAARCYVDPAGGVLPWRVL